MGRGERNLLMGTRDQRWETVQWVGEKSPMAAVRRAEGSGLR